MTQTPASFDAVPQDAAALQVAAMCLALRAPGAEMAAVVDRVCEQAQLRGLDDAADDLARIRNACARLCALIEEFADAPRAARENPAQWLATQGHLRHDLRTPLNAVKGYGDMLIDDWSAGPGQPLQDDLRATLRLADQLLALIATPQETP